jgi:hypothetical protein
LQHIAAHGDGAGGHDQQFDVGLGPFGEVVDEGVEPFLTQFAFGGIDQQGRSDLDDDAPEIGEFGVSADMILPGALGQEG